MTLLDLATFICTKVSQSETEDLEACKDFLQRRFEMIWADQLWHDSLFEYTQTLSALNYDVDSTWLPTKQVLLLPEQFGHVVAVRTDTRKANVLSSEELYRMDYDTFLNAGSLIQYRLLKPCAWEVDTAKTLNINASGLAAGDTLDIWYLDGDGVTLKSVSANDAGQPPSIYALRIDSAKKKQVSGESVYLSDSVTAGRAFTLTTTDLVLPKRVRIQLFGVIPEGAVIRVLGKTNAPAFTDDADEPGLTGVENCILAFAQADMLQRERQYGKAQALQQEGQMLLDQLKKVRTVQQAHHKRLIPESGYGDEYQLNAGAFGAFL